MSEHTDTAGRENNSVTGMAILLVALLVSALLLGALAFVSTPVDAQQNNSTTSYYGNQTNSTPANGTWLAGKEDGSLDDQVSLLTRLATIIVGSGPTTQGGGGPAGVLVFGLVLLAGATATVGQSTMGSVGGASLLVAVAAGVVQLGFVPAWLWAIVLLGIGLVVTAAVLRAVR